MPTHRAIDRRLSLHLLGVVFYWRRRLGRGFDESNLQEQSELHARILTVARKGMERQRRSRVGIEDAMTYLEKANLPRRVREIPEVQLACELLPGLGKGTLRTERIQELVDHRLVQLAQSRLVCEGIDSNSSTDPWESRAMEYDIQGTLHPRKAGIYRCLGLDLTDLSDPAKIDHDSLLALAVLINIRAELELFFLSGFRRFRRCERASCGAWFVSKRMAGRVRFCSNTCRVGHAYETSSSA